MSNEQREALELAKRLAPTSISQIQWNLIAAALQEARANGIDEGSKFQKPKYLQTAIRADAARLRAEAQALREGSHE